jgi:hypothetical protein
LRWVDDKLWVGRLAAEGQAGATRAIVVDADSNPAPQLVDLTMRAFRNVERTVRGYRWFAAAPGAPGAAWNEASLATRYFQLADLGETTQGAIAAMSTSVPRNVPKSFLGVSIPDQPFSPKTTETVLIVDNMFLSARSVISYESEVEVKVTSTIRLDGRDGYVFAPFLVSLDSSFFSGSTAMTAAAVGEGYGLVAALLPDVKEKEIFLEDGDEFSVEQTFSTSDGEFPIFALVQHPVLISTEEEGAPGFDCILAPAYVPVPFALGLTDCPFVDLDGG